MSPGFDFEKCWEVDVYVLSDTVEPEAAFSPGRVHAHRSDLPGQQFWSGPVFPKTRGSGALGNAGRSGGSSHGREKNGNCQAETIEDMASDASLVAELEALFAHDSDDNDTGFGDEAEEKTEDRMFDMGHGVPPLKSGYSFDSTTCVFCCE